MSNQLSSDDAVQIWIRRWLGHQAQDIQIDYRVSPFRVYEVWGEEKFRGSRGVAKREFLKLYPGLEQHVDFSPHRKRRKVVDSAA
jgi:hypothetical protein